MGVAERRVEWFLQEQRCSANRLREIRRTAFTCDKPSGADQWWHVKPENSLTGVSYRNGGGTWAGPREPVGFQVPEACAS